ncbi:MAG TPA: peptidylprolyl isomerase [Planctomycetota bacterium]|nr:peptidylprolyl isomerase [Planctomycetota bacterium]
MNPLASLTLAMLATPTVRAAAPPPARQDPGDVLAHYQLEGKPRTVTKSDVALEMAFHLRRRDRGKQACDALVDTLLTRQAATRAGLMPREAEVRAYWDELQKQLQAAGHRPEDFAAVRNTSQAELFDYLAVQIAQERLVRHELALGPKEAVSGDMLKLWLQEARRKRKVVTDPDQLPAGTAVRVEDTNVPLIDLGLLLLRTSEDEERDRFIRQVVYLQSIEALARQKGVQLAAADLDAAIQRRREAAANDPRYRGISLEQMLQAEGLTVAALREQRVFRSQALLDKLALVMYPDADLAAELQRSRQAVLDVVGPRRRLGIVFLRAFEKPNAIVTLDFRAAMKRLATVRERLAKETFENVARIESDDPDTKAQGGDAGWHRRGSDKLPREVLDAAFALGADEVSQPVRASEGCFLVKVLDVDPTPSDPQLVERLREYRARELAQKVLLDAAIEMVK